MSTDTTEDARRALLAAGVPQADLENVLAKGGQVWDTKQLTEEFEVLGFAAPFVVVKRRSDGQKGSLEFTHRPRFYFGWDPHVD